MNDNQPMSWSLGYPETERLSFEFLSPPADPTTEDLDWVHTRVTIRVGGFTGKADMMLTLTDVSNFKKEAETLYETLKGTAEFTTVEDQIGFKIEADNLGQLTVTGFFKDDAGAGNTLTFEMSLDQTHLKNTISELEKLGIRDQG